MIDVILSPRSIFLANNEGNNKPNSTSSYTWCNLIRLNYIKEQVPVKKLLCKLRIKAQDSKAL